MTKRLFALLLATVPFAAVAAPEGYTLDPVHSSMNFMVVEHMGIAPIYGRFNKFNGKFMLDRAAKAGMVEINIDTASVDTNDNDKGSRARSRDEHLRSGDFFNVAEFPRMTYKSTGVTFNGDNPATIDGSLTLLGVTKPVQLTVERFKCNPASGNNKERCGGLATGKIKRTDFGMKTGVPSISDEIALVLAFEAPKD